MFPQRVLPSRFAAPVVLPVFLLIASALLSSPDALARTTAKDKRAVAVPVVLAGHIVAVADGDTVTLLDSDNRQHRIRLAGIDAPERRQAFGTRSRQALGALAHQRVAQADCNKQDRYGRLVCTLWVDGQDVNLEQLRTGMAWHYRAYAREQPAAERAAYEAAQTQAQAARVGLWADAEPMAPWTFRKESRK